jgi:hypothetical protein
MRDVLRPHVRVWAAVVLALLAPVGTVAVPVPAAAEPVGWVSGTVSASGAPLANAWVTLMPVTPTGGWAGKQSQTTTDRDGHYEFRDLAAAQVKVHVRAPSFSGLASTYWPGAHSFATAGTLRVQPSGSTADVELAAGGSISGQVVDADTGAPIVGARVLAHVEAPPGWEPVGSAGLAPGPGQFVIDGLPPVPVALQARAPQGSNHLGQWFDGAGFFGEADPVQPGTTGIVVRLREGAQVGGVVRDDRGGPVAGAAVTLIGCPALCPMVALTDDTGIYRINGVPPGGGLRAYVDAAAEGLLDRWYTAPGQHGDSTFDLAAGQVRSDLDFALTAGAVVVGRVLDEQTGQAIPGVSIELVDVDNPLRSHLSRAVGSPGGESLGLSAGPSGAPSASPAAPGPEPSPPARDQGAEVAIGPVPPGRYTLVVYAGAANSNYLPVELVASTGLDAAGQIDLARGERAQVTVTLVRQHTSTQDGPGLGDAQDGTPPTPEPGAGEPDPVGSSGWPGLFAGFLAIGGPGLLQRGS